MADYTLEVGKSLSTDVNTTDRKTPLQLKANKVYINRRGGTVRIVKETPGRLSYPFEDTDGGFYMNDGTFLQHCESEYDLVEEKIDSDIRANPSLKSSIPDNLRWLADQSHRPDYMPCGMLTGAFLIATADLMRSLIKVDETDDSKPPSTHDTKFSQEMLYRS